MAKKYHVGIVNVAAKYILDKPSVAGVIIGARLVCQSTDQRTQWSFH
ncbi:MAG TPA: hypothetical protein VIG05_00015 [Candidatus Nitrosotenuis sp.]